MFADAFCIDYRRQMPIVLLPHRSDNRNGTYFGLFPATAHNLERRRLEKDTLLAYQRDGKFTVIIPIGFRSLQE